MMESQSLVELDDQEVRIHFTPNAKCRANVRLRSLCATCHVAFKVQTSSPHKFLVNPPAGLIAPLSCAIFQVILKPQLNPPNPFPRSPSDRFLIRTAQFPTHQLGKPGQTQPNSVISWFASRAGTGPTRDHKLKTAFVGPFLLRHAVMTGDHDAARNLIKRQRSILAELPPSDSEALLRAASELDEPEDMLTLLLESGLKIGFGSTPATSDFHVAAAKGDRTMDVMLMEAGTDPTLVDNRGHSRTDDDEHDKGHVSSSGVVERGEAVLTSARRGDLTCLELLLKSNVDLKFCDQYGLTALHTAAMKGHKDVLLRLIEFGADLECGDHDSHSPLHLAVIGGNLEAVRVLVDKGAKVNVKSRTRVSPLYMATAMGYHDIAEFLISKGASSSS